MSWPAISRGALATFLLVAWTPILHAADWQGIKPNVTSEAELIAAFGPPDEVVSTYPWDEWNAK